jgi:LysM repeat protein
MKSWKGVVFFLFINVVVSACVILSVLYFWDRNRDIFQNSVLPPLIPQLSPEATGDASEPLAPQPTATQETITYVVKDGDDFTTIAERFGVKVEDLVAVNGFNKDQPLGVGEVLIIPTSPTPVPQGVIQIKNVVGAGDLSTERVLIKFSGTGELSLQDWKLEDGSGKVYVFPMLVLYKDGAVNVYSKSGADSVIELYWGLSEPAWQSGETATLRDARGSVQATYQVP